MMPEIDIGPLTVPTYGLVVMIGLALGMLQAIHRPLFPALNRDDILFSAIYGGIGLAVGGKVLYLLTILPLLWPLRGQMEFSLPLLEAMLTGGFVFYGGLFGAMLGVHLYARQFRKDFAKLWDNLVLSLPLMHMVGRIGCFLAGCCHGLEVSSRWGLPFAVNGLESDRFYFPLQLVESLGNLLIFLSLRRFRHRTRPRFFFTSVYFLLYATMRFGLEFFRGDPLRGVVAGLSTSQWISLAMLPIALCLLLRSPRPQKEPS